MEQLFPSHFSLLLARKCKAIAVLCRTLPMLHLVNQTKLLFWKKMYTNRLLLAYYCCQLQNNVELIWIFHVIWSATQCL